MSETSGAWEATRVARHIRRAEGYAGQRPVPASPLRRLARQLLLSELAHYRSRGRFPKNRDFAAPTPYFVDDAGNRCAVAHLLEASGEGGLVQRIARTRNHARVAELVDEPRLVAWLEAAGLSLEEAALIQPSYCFDRHDCVCGRKATGYFEAVTVSEPTRGIALARVEAIHGSPTESSVRVGDEVRVSVGERELGAELLLFGYALRGRTTRLYWAILPARLRRKLAAAEQRRVPSRSPGGRLRGHARFHRRLPLPLRRQRRL